MSITPELRPKRSSRAGGSGRRCFIAAHAHTDLQPIRRLLEERKIEVVVPHETPSFGTSVVSKITSLIDDSDIFIAVLEDLRYGANVLFELGYAFARGKKILLIYSPHYGGLPIDLASTLYIRAEPDDAEAVSFALDQLLSSPSQQQRASAPAGPPSRPIGDLADHFLTRLHAVGSRDEASELEQIVSDALRASGISVIVDTGQRDLGADLALWSDELETWVGNPLLIELKYRIPTVSAAKVVYDQVRSYMRATHSGWTLVLYVEGPAAVDQPLRSLPHVLFMNLQDFIEGLRKRSFAEIIRDLRNRVAHVR